MHRRLEKLEARTHEEQGYKTPRRVERYLHILENARHRTRGLKPLPDLPYTKEDYEDDLRTLQETIPAMKESPGWQKEQSRTFLDSWAHDVTERIERYAHD